MNRAIEICENDKCKRFVPIIVEQCELPENLQSKEHLHINMTDTSDNNSWNKLLKSLELYEEINAPLWISGRNSILLSLKRNSSVNLVCDKDSKACELLDHIRSDYMPNLGIVDLEAGVTFTRRGFLEQILESLNINTRLPESPHDLVEFDRLIRKGGVYDIAIKHFDMSSHRQVEYDINLFSAFRNLITGENKRLNMIIHSHNDFMRIIPDNNPMSNIPLTTVEIKRR
jgi:hypothetical protein